MKNQRPGQFVLQSHVIISNIAEDNAAIVFVRVFVVFQWLKWRSERLWSFLASDVFVPALFVMTLSGKKSSVILSINTHLAPPTLTRHRCHHCTNKHVFASSKRKTQFTPTITAEGFKSEARARLCFYDCIRWAGSSVSASLRFLLLLFKNWIRLQVGVCWDVNNKGVRVKPMRRLFSQLTVYCSWAITLPPHVGHKGTNTNRNTIALWVVHCPLLPKGERARVRKRVCVCERERGGSIRAKQSVLIQHYISFHMELILLLYKGQAHGGQEFTAILSCSH